MRTMIMWLIIQQLLAESTNSGDINLPIFFSKLPSAIDEMKKIASIDLDGFSGLQRSSYPGPTEGLKIRFNT